MADDLRVLLGERRYQVVRPFGGVGLLRGISAVCVRSDGAVCVLQRSQPPVMVLDTDGTVVDAFGWGVVADGHGIAAALSGGVWVVDRDAHELLEFAPDGGVVRRVGTRHHPRNAAPFNHPAAVAQAAGGQLYVADGYGNNHVHVLSADGAHLHTWGGDGTDPAGLVTPHGIVVDTNGCILVADREGDRVQRYAPEGAWLGSLEGLYKPMDLAVDRDGGVIVSDQVPSLVRFGAEGTRTGRGRAAASAGHGIDIAVDGTIYIAEPPPVDRITQLRPLSVVGSDDGCPTTGRHERAAGRDRTAPAQEEAS